MFDLGATELLLVAIVALVVIGPKDLPGAMRGVGRVLGQLRSITGQFRFGLDEMIREAEMEEQEKAWAKRNADIMAENPPQDEVHQAPDPMTADTEKAGTTDSEMKPLKSIAGDNAGEISSAAHDETTTHQDNPDVSDSEHQDDLFGDRK